MYFSSFLRTCCWTLGFASAKPNIEPDLKIAKARVTQLDQKLADFHQQQKKRTLGIGGIGRTCVHAHGDATADVNVVDGQRDATPLDIAGKVEHADKKAAMVVACGNWHTVMVAEEGGAVLACGHHSYCHLYSRMNLTLIWQYK